MKKKLGLMLFVSWLLLFSTTMAINENKKEKIYENVSQSDWESLSNNYWSKAICKEEKEVEVYSWEYRVIWDHFKNSNPKGGLSYYILDAKSMDSWNYILYNTSSDGYNNELVIWNSSVFQNRAWWSKIQPWEIVRHMSTAEEVGGTFKYWPWTLSSPVTDSLDNKKFQKANYRSDGSHPNKPTMSPNWDAEIRIMTLYDEDHNPGSSSDNKVIVECQKMVIRRCGDGILDEEHEECDPEVEPWKSDGTCDPETCKIAPKCNSKYNWKVVTGDLRKANDLCEVWNVTNLVETETNWTWNCDGVWDPVACSATKRKQGTPDIEKTLKDKIPVSHTWQKLDWEVKVTAKGWDITDFEIKDVMPKELEYLSWSYSGQKPNWITVTKEERTETSWDNIVHYWSVDWTLEEWKTLTIIVNTKVVKMPASWDNIINIACVIDDNNVIDCDDDTPPSPEWKPVIQKTLIDKIPVDHTWQQLDWNVKVTAKGWDITDFVISDIVPRELDYKDREIGENGDRLNVTYRDGASHSTWNGAEVHYWDVAWTLKSWHYLTIKVKTEVKEMPDPNKDIKNIACVQLSGSDYVECDNDKTGNPKLRIKKHILSGNNLVKVKTGVKVWDKITYRIDFGNSGDAVGTIVSIKDFLPKNVKYLNSEIFIVTGTNSSSEQVWTGIVWTYQVSDGVYIDIFGGITLQPGQRWYIIITGEILSDFPDQRTNFACIYDDDDLIACDDASHKPEEDDGYKCKSLTIKSATISPSWRTVVECTTTSSRKANIEIDCGSGAKVRYITWSNVSLLTGTCSYAKNWKYTVTCKVDGENPPKSCTWNVTVKSSCFPAWTKVMMADGSQKNIEDIREWDIVLSYNVNTNSNEKNVVKQRIIHENNVHEMYELTINWKVLNVTDAHRFYVRESLTSKNYNWIEAKNLKVGDILLMSDGKLVKIEKINHYNNKETVYNLTVENNHNYFVAEWYLVHNSKKPTTSPTCNSLKEEGDNLVCTASENAYFRVTCDGDFLGNVEGQDEKTKYINIPYSKYKNCKEVKCYVSDSKNSGRSWTPCERENKESNPEGESQECINVNAGNFSIHEWEIFPFYWNMANLNSEYYNQENSYTTIDWDYTNPESKYSKNLECNKGDENKIAMDSMICTFNIYDANVYTKRYENWETKNHPLYTIKWPCLSSKSVIENEPLIKDWYNTMVENYCKDKECYFYYGTKGNYGGYNGKDIVLPTAVYFIEKFGTWARLSVDAGWGWTTWDLKREDSPEKDKSFWEYKIELSNVEYLKCDGEYWTKVENKDMDPCQSDFMLTNSYTVQKTPSGNLTASTEKLKNYRFYNGTQTFSDLLKAIQTTSYNKNDKVENAMKTFTSKYEKLAVNVKGGIADRDSNKKATIKKVPWKSIYFVDGDVVINGTKDIKSPFTMVVKWNVTIEWNVNNNMMVLAEKNIIFKWDCESTQTVKWIFYAGGNLIRQWVDKNDDIKNNKRCTEWWLHVKWVLIWNNFNKLMDDSRSNINKWFGVEWSEQEIINKRRKIVMDWASVVIEYSPSIFTKSTMPPGAEDFTTALSIYKN